MDTPTPAQPAATLKTIAILRGALLAGLLTFTGVVCGMILTGSLSTSPAMTGTFAMVLAMLGPSELGAYLLAVRPPLMREAKAAWEASVKDASAGQTLFGAFVTRSIMAGALAEGFGLFATVVLMLTGEWLFLIGVALSALIQIASFPTKGRLAAFIRDITGQLPQ